jgi:hypothetical protein
VKVRDLGILVCALLVVGFAIIGLLVREDRKQRAEAALRTSPTSAPTIHETSTGLLPPTGIFDASSPLADRQKRDELRRKILEAWAKGERGPEVAAEAKQGRFEEHPNPDGSGIEPKYIQAAVREQMFPMARACYEDFLTRKPDAGGTMHMWFKIVADENLGGVVEEDEDHDAGIIESFGDPKMEVCMRESLLTVTFPPPAKGGVVTVGYPVVFSAQDDDGDGGK